MHRCLVVAFVSKPVPLLWGSLRLVPFVVWAVVVAVAVVAEFGRLVETRSNKSLRRIALPPNYDKFLYVHSESDIAVCVSQGVSLSLYLSVYVHRILDHLCHGAPHLPFPSIGVVQHKASQTDAIRRCNTKNRTAVDDRLTSTNPGPCRVYP